MNLPRGPLITKVLLVLTCLAILSIYIDRIVRVYVAQRYANPQQVNGLERAIRLLPGDAEFPNLLGLQLSAAGQDHDRAIANLRKAVILNPNRGHYWLDLASMYQVAGNIEKESETVQSAVHAEPGNPEVAAEAAQLFLASGDADRAFPLFRQALEQNPDAAYTILSVCWRETGDAQMILSRAIPANPEFQVTLLRILVEEGESAAASDVWQAIVAAHRPFPPQLSFFYFDYLLRERDAAGFNLAWHQLATLDAEMQAYLPNNNLIVNASFEQPLLNSGFDWRHEPTDHIAVGIDDKTGHSGTRSLSLSYDGNPAYESGWTQFIPVEPDAEYDFSVWVKSKNITSSSGPRIAIADAFGEDNLLMTDDVLDTHSWQELKGTFRAPVDTALVKIKVIRAPANTRIRGQVWIDDLRLVKR